MEGCTTEKMCTLDWDGGGCLCYCRPGAAKAGYMRQCLNQLRAGSRPDLLNFSNPVPRPEWPSSDQ